MTKRDGRDSTMGHETLDGLSSETSRTASAEEQKTWLAAMKRRVERFGYVKTALIVTFVIVLGVISARYYYSLVTGYIVPDEAWYFNNYVLDKQPISSSPRPVYIAVFLLFFHNVTNVWQFFGLGFLYSSICATGSMIICYKIIRRLEVSEKTSALLLLSLPLFPVFIVMAPTMVTEPLGLFLGLLGVYLTLRHVQEGNATDAFLSGISFVLAYKVREPYLLFAVGNLLLYLVLLAKRRSVRGFLAYAVPVSLVFPVPLQLQPLEFAQPVSTLLMNLIAQLNYWLFAATPSPSTVTLPPPTVTPPPSMVPVLTPAFGMVTLTASQHPDYLWALAVGLWYGYNPLFAIFALVSLPAIAYVFLRTKSLSVLFLLLNAAVALASFAVSLIFTIATLPGAISAWTSTIVRETHTSLVSFIGLGCLYERLGPKRVAGLIILVLLLLGSTQAASFADTFQRSLSREPVDRLSLGYRAPYYRLYVLAKDCGKTLVFGGLHLRGIRIYMSMLPNVLLSSVPGSESGFNELLARQWDAIFLYDDFVTITVPSMIEAYPTYYGNILRSREYPGYAVQTLWVDGESYALKMTATTARSIVSHADCPSFETHWCSWQFDGTTFAPCQTIEALAEGRS